MDPTLTNLRSLIAEHAVIDADQIGITDTLADIGLDSLDIIELVLEIEEHFEIEIAEDQYPDTSTSVAHLHDLIETLQAA